LNNLVVEKLIKSKLNIIAGNCKVGKLGTIGKLSMSKIAWK
jgi:hypothetical protein